MNVKMIQRKEAAIPQIPKIPQLRFTLCETAYYDVMATQEKIRLKNSSIETE